MPFGPVPLFGLSAAADFPSKLRISTTGRSVNYVNTTGNNAAAVSSFSRNQEVETSCGFHVSRRVLEAWRYVVLFVPKVCVEVVLLTLLANFPAMKYRLYEPPIAESNVMLYAVEAGSVAAVGGMCSSVGLLLLATVSGLLSRRVNLCLSILALAVLGFGCYLILDPETVVPGSGPVEMLWPLTCLSGLAAGWFHCHHLLIVGHVMEDLGCCKVLMGLHRGAVQTNNRTTDDYHNNHQASLSSSSRDLNFNKSFRKSSEGRSGEDDGVVMLPSPRKHPRTVSEETAVSERRYSDEDKQPSSLSTAGTVPMADNHRRHSHSGDGSVCVAIPPPAATGTQFGQWNVGSGSGQWKVAGGSNTVVTPRRLPRRRETYKDRLSKKSVVDFFRSTWRTSSVLLSDRRYPVAIVMLCYTGMGVAFLTVSVIESTMPSISSGRSQRRLYAIFTAVVNSVALSVGIISFFVMPKDRPQANVMPDAERRYCKHLESLRESYLLSVRDFGRAFNCTNWRQEWGKLRNVFLRLVKNRTSLHFILFVGCVRAFEVYYILFWFPFAGVYMSYSINIIWGLPTLLLCSAVSIFLWAFVGHVFDLERATTMSISGILTAVIHIISVFTISRTSPSAVSYVFLACVGLSHGGLLESLVPLTLGLFDYLFLKHGYRKDHWYLWVSGSINGIITSFAVFLMFGISGAAWKDKSRVVYTLLGVLPAMAFIGVSIHFFIFYPITRKKAEAVRVALCRRYTGYVCHDPVVRGPPLPPLDEGMLIDFLQFLNFTSPDQLRQIAARAKDSCESHQQLVISHPHRPPPSSSSLSSSSSLNSVYDAHCDPSGACGVHSASQQVIVCELCLPPFVPTLHQHHLIDSDPRVVLKDGQLLRHHPTDILVPGSATDSSNSGSAPSQRTVAECFSRPGSPAEPLPSLSCLAAAATIARQEPASASARNNNCCTSVVSSADTGVGCVGGHVMPMAVCSPMSSFECPPANCTGASRCPIALRRYQPNEGYGLAEQLACTKIAGMQVAKMKDRATETRRYPLETVDEDADNVEFSRFTLRRLSDGYAPPQRPQLDVDEIVAEFCVPKQGSGNSRRHVIRQQQQTSSTSSVGITRKTSGSIDSNDVSGGIADQHRRRSTGDLSTSSGNSHGSLLSPKKVGAAATAESVGEKRGAATAGSTASASNSLPTIPPPAASRQHLRVSSGAPQRTPRCPSPRVGGGGGGWSGGRAAPSRCRGGGHSLSAHREFIGSSSSPSEDGRARTLSGESSRSRSSSLSS